MTLEQEIISIREGIKSGRFTNEAAVSQGVVLRLLHILEWPAYDTHVVWPEYSLAGRRVDFALCHPAKKPLAFIEVKQIGQSDGAERQLFEYAFHVGVPLAILTDGKEWNFYLPAEQGDYAERRVYKLDIVERTVEESSFRLRRYLLHSDIISGAAIKSARDDYLSVSRDRQIKEFLPKAWSYLVDNEDEFLIEIVADRVENLCGFKPSDDMVARFLKELFNPQPKPPVAPSPRVKSPIPPPQSSRLHAGFNVDGEFRPARNGRDLVMQILEVLASKDQTFLERFSQLQRHGKKRRYIARNPNELYPDNPGLIRYSIQLTSGWWFGTNNSKETMTRIIKLALQTAYPDHGKNITFSFGDS